MVDAHTTVTTLMEATPAIATEDLSWALTAKLAVV
jgi:hypothetical protein